MSTAVTQDTNELNFPASTLNPLAWRRWWLSMDKDPTALAFAQTFAGQAIIHAGLIGCLLLVPVLRTSHLALVSMALIMCWAWPQRRLMVLSITGVAYFLLRPFKVGSHYDYFKELADSAIPGIPMAAATIPLGLLFLLFAWLMIRNQERKYLPAISNCPLLFMFTVGISLAALSVWLQRDSALFAPVWVALTYMASTFFFLGYILLDQRTKTKVPVHTQMGFMRPFWAGFAPPMKGPAYFLKAQANSETDLAVSRLKGIKLAVWAVILFMIWEWGFNRLVYGWLAFPRLDDLIVEVASGASVNLATRWASVAADFFALVVYMGAAVHAVVAVVRVSGFCIRRGMARPLSSRTIAEFWGRYLFYFKEMLVDFFFYPTFRRFFKNYPRLRMAFATFAAAFVGNILFDFIHSAPLVAFEGGEKIWEGFISYCVYAGILSSGIILSQLVGRAPQPQDGYFRYNVLPRAKVIAFFALLQIVDDVGALVPIGDRLSFLFGLFGVN